METIESNLFKQALDLDEKDRATLARLLIESLEEKVGDDLEAIWKAEVARRVAQLKTGEVQLISWDDVKARLLKQDYGA